MSPSSSDRSGPPVARIALTIGWVIAGIMLLSTGALRWVKEGPGSSFGGLELADNLRNGVFSPDWGVWVAVSVYSLVALGGVWIATSSLVHLAVAIVRAVFSIAGLGLFIVFGWVVLPIDKWAPGPTIATIAFLLATVLSAAQLVTASRR